MDKIKLLNKIINESSNIVFFGGAGVSTESGLKDFRSVDGIYNLNYKYPPEYMLSHKFFFTNTDEFYKFYRNQILFDESKILPNDCHLKLSELESSGKLKAIITQNIDGLHQKAKSKNVINLHGSIYSNHCTFCKKHFEGFDFILKSSDVPMCDHCGHIIKPDVVLYGESLNENDVNNAIDYICSADVLIIGGCSLLVYPAASFINYFKGRYIIVINKTPLDEKVKSDLYINDSIGKTMKQVEIN